MKRILCILFVVAMFWQILPAAEATEIPTITVSSHSFCAGVTAQVTVSLANNPGYCSLTAEILYDETALKLTKIEAVHTPGMFASNPEANRVAAAGISEIKEDGPMFTLYFDVLAAGEHTVSVEMLTLANESGEELPVQIVSGMIRAQVHNYQTETREVSCAVSGATVHTCLACGDQYETDIVPATGHVFDDEKDVICNACGFDTSKPLKPDHTDIPVEPDHTDVLQKDDSWLIILLVVLIVAVIVLTVMVTMLLLRRRKVDTIPLPNLDDLDEYYEEEEETEDEE